MSNENMTRAKGDGRSGAYCDTDPTDAEVSRGDESEESDDEDVSPEITLDALSADTLAALKAHLAIRDATQAEEGGEHWRDTGAAPESNGLVSDGLVSEDFGLSQFWYDDETQKALAREVLEGAAGGKAAVISAPSVMNGIKLLRETGWSSSSGCTATVYIMEYDRRFDKAYPDAYLYYDYNEPTMVPDELRGSMDYILMDPPYLSTECVGKFLETAEVLARRPTAGQGAEKPTPVMFITSPLNRTFLRERGGLRWTPYRLGFKSKFATPMALYTNYVGDELGGWIEEEEEENGNDIHKNDGE